MCCSRILSESIPWLVLNGKIEEAERVMKRAARWNKITLPDRIFTDVKSEEMKFMHDDVTKSEEDANKYVTLEKDNTKEKALVPEYSSNEPVTEDELHYTFVDVMKSNKLCLYTMILIVVW
jgi:hypothetical protein